MAEYDRKKMTSGAPQQLGGYRKNEAPLDQRELLNQNFLCYDGKGPVPEKKLKVFHLEAVRAGFKKAWQKRDYAVIIGVAEKIPNKILEEDRKLLMWYDQTVTRLGGGMQ